MTPTLPDNWDEIRSSMMFRAISTPKSEKEKMEELRTKINNHLDRKGIINPQIRIELIKLILEDEENFQ